MRLLANENIPLASIRILENAGHDVASVSERCLGAADEIVVQVARSENRTIITFDRDYGELIFRRRLPAPAGIVYLRFAPRNPADAAAYVLRLIDDGIVLEGRFTTADRGGCRQTLLDRLWFDHRD